MPGALRAFAALCALLALAFPGALAVAAPKVDVYLFWREGCPHCEREIEFLDALAARERALRVHKFEVLKERANASLMLRAAGSLGAEAGSVPFTIVGDRVFVGYLDDRTSGLAIEQRVRECLAQACPDSVRPLLEARGAASAAAATKDPRTLALPEHLRLPLLGEVSTASLSLPVLTVVLAALDGFNPCAMWVLVFLLGLLAGIGDRLRMWVLGGAFVAASAFVYLLFLAAWLNALLFASTIVWIRGAIGVVALAGGGYYLRNFALGQAAVCDVTAPQSRRAVLERLRTLAQQRDFLVALGGVVLLAFAVNLVELLCSAGIPAVFTQVLALSALSAWQYAAYLLLYVLVFMLDDLVVLGVALKTMEVAGLTTTYARWSNLAGGLLLIAIGAALILRPEWLTFS